MFKLYSTRAQFELSRRARSVVEHPLGKGEVEGSIHSGSTSHHTSVGPKNSGKIGLLSHACAQRLHAVALPASTGTNHETPARVTRFWHAPRTGAAPTFATLIAEVVR